jgi:hypothetical protein
MLILCLSRIAAFALTELVIIGELEKIGITEKIITTTINILISLFITSYHVLSAQMCHETAFSPIVEDFVSNLSLHKNYIYY